MNGMINTFQNAPAKKSNIEIALFGHTGYSANAAVAGFKHEAENAVVSMIKMGAYIHLIFQMEGTDAGLDIAARELGLNRSSAYTYARIGKAFGEAVNVYKQQGDEKGLSRLTLRMMDLLSTFPDERIAMDQGEIYVDGLPLADYAEKDQNSVKMQKELAVENVREKLAELQDSLHTKNAELLEKEQEIARLKKGAPVISSFDLAVLTATQALANLRQETGRQLGNNAADDVVQAMEEKFNKLFDQLSSAKSLLLA